MKRSELSNSAIFLLSAALWIGIIIMLFVLGDERYWWLIYLLPSSFVTICGTAWVWRFWLRRKKRASYGTLFGVPFCSALFVWVALHLLEPHTLTPSYWRQAKGSFTGELVICVGFTAAVCILPAISVIAYYRRRITTNDVVA